MTLFFDAQCRMCTRVARLLRVLFGVELHDAWSDIRAKECMLEKGTWVLIKDKKEYYKADVIRELFLSRLYTYPLGKIIEISFISKWATGVYDHIAKNRCKNGVCTY